MSKTCIIIDQTTINTIIGKTNKKDNDTMNSDILNEKRRIANQTFVEACTKLGVYYDNACGQYRDIHTNRFVKRINLENINMKYDDNIESTYVESPTGIEVVEDILPPLPDYSNMNLEEMLNIVTYGKNTIHNDIIIRRRMVDEKGNLIPVRKANDGGEWGYNRWSKNGPDEMFTNRAAYWAERIIEFMGVQELEKLDKIIDQHSTLADAVTPVIDIAMMFQEDYIEKIQKNYDEKRRAFNAWLIKVFGLPLAKEVKKNINNELDIKVEEARTMGSDMDAIFDISGTLSKSGEWADEGHKHWIEHSNGPMSVLSKHIKSMGNMARMNPEAWRRAATYFSTYFWYKLQGFDNMETARNSKMYAIKQYAYARFAIISLEAKQEQATRDAGIDADIPSKTDWNLRFVKDNFERAWENHGMYDFE